MENQRRKTVRLQEYDYSSAGCYFVTICAKDRKSLFGKMNGDEVDLSKLGELIKQQWLDLEKRYSIIRLDEFVIMPNHFHGIIAIEELINVGTPLVGVQVSDQGAIDRAGTSPAPTINIDEELINVGTPLVGVRIPDQGVIDRAGTSPAPTENANIFDVGTPLVGVQVPDQGVIDRAGTSPAPTEKNPTLGDIVGSFKSICQNEWINHLKNNNQFVYQKIWQKRYFDHVIRNEESYNKIRTYIINNPAQWQSDQYYNN